MIAQLDLDAMICAEAKSLSSSAGAGGTTGPGRLGDPVYSKAPCWHISSYLVLCVLHMVVTRLDVIRIRKALVQGAGPFDSFQQPRYCSISCHSEAGPAT